ncbi:MAG TPA: ABC transporter substrate-binding protein [Gemmatimonadaceae bacterium]
MRVAALLPAATDIVLALGAGDQLVAVTHACVVPPTLGGVPRVTRSRVVGASASALDAHVSDLASAGAPMFDVDEPLLASRHPEVILTQAVCEVCAVREADARAVAARLHPPSRVATLGASTVEGILADILTVASALHLADEGEELVLGLRSRMAAVHRRLKAEQAPRPRVLVLEWTDPPFNAGHWVPDMVRRAGGLEVLGRAGEISRRVSIDEIQAANPDVVVIAPCGYAMADALREVSPWPGANATPVWVIDANRLTSSPGPGVVHGIEVLARILHPALFGAPSPRDAVQITR